MQDAARARRAHPQPGSVDQIVHVAPVLVRADGVADFQRRLVEELADESARRDDQRSHLLLTTDEIRSRTWPEGQSFHFQLPMQGWRRDLAVFRFPLFLHRHVKKPRIFLTLHEWRDTKVLRRIVNLPFMAIVDEVVVPSTELVSELRTDPIAKRLNLHRRTRTIPIGPNYRLPAAPAAARSDHSFRLGYFGFLYPGKRPALMLDVLRRLRDDGVDAKLVMVGDFLPQFEQHRPAFDAQIAQQGLADHVEWHGFVEQEEAVMRILGTCDAFLLLNARGFTDRNGSVLTCLQLGLPVVTSASYSGHALPDWMKPLQSAGVLRLVDDRAGVEAVADAVRSACDSFVSAESAPFDLWRKIASAYLGLYDEGAGRRI